MKSNVSAHKDSRKVEEERRDEDRCIWLAFGVHTETRAAALAPEACSRIWCEHVRKFICSISFHIGSCKVRHA